ncbi:AraC family transcriptional regulator [Paenibacillus sp. JJ-223]|uniref:helix-turn-helix domain-containing protein n=1 Tax=Paenibacillus sp. JJ-223 TaxID=2905647 RepID=UPI001F1BC10B|nr:AraC family transcriptional regulator [Paenibacillus sp. JJ-223]CAH1190635.1 HTH-type transcriptional activator Btr [Paenibacillus sp. JJ-223]
MKPVIEIFKGEYFFRDQLKLFVNRVSENFAGPFHAHDFVEYSYVSGGRGFHHIGNEVIPVHQGMLFVIPVGVPHVFRPATTDVSKHPLTISNCLFNAELIQELAGMIQEPEILSHLNELEQNKAPYVFITDHGRRIEDLMARLHRECSVPGIGSSTMLYTLVSQLVVTTYRFIHRVEPNDPVKPPELDHIIQYLEQHLAEKTRLSDLARLCNCSDKQIQRMFRTQTGQSFGSFLQHLRIQKSCELLKRSQHKVSLIAELVGYRDVDSFYANFKKITGDTPLAYRKKHTPHSTHHG